MLAKVNTRRRILTARTMMVMMRETSLMPETLQQPSSLVETPKQWAASSATALMIFKPGPAEEVHVPYFSLEIRIRMKGVRDMTELLTQTNLVVGHLTHQVRIINYYHILTLTHFVMSGWEFLCWPEYLCVPQEKHHLAPCPGLHPNVTTQHQILVTPLPGPCHQNIMHCLINVPHTFV